MDSNRPIRADAARNRESILAAAELVLGRDGPGFSTESVAQEAGVGIGTVFRHFHTKEGLLRAVVAHRLDALAEEAASVDPTDPSATFAFLEFVAEQSARKRALVHALTALSLNAEEVLEDVGGPFRLAVAELVTSAQQADVIRSDVGARDVLDLLIALAHTTEPEQWATPNRPLALAVVIDGLRPR